MNPVIDPKALVKTSHINLNHLQTQLRAQAKTSGGGMVFQRALTQAQQTGTGGNSTSILGPQTASVSVQSGDTLSGIVRQFMAASGKNVGQTALRTYDLKAAQMVRRGQLVMVSSGEGKGFLITLRAEAQQDGILGEQIRLKNPESGRSLSAVITGFNAARAM